MFRRFWETDWDKPWLRVEEFVEGDALVVRAELPGIDPDKDVDLAVVDGVLHITANREEKSEHKEKDSYRSEFRYGSYSRNIPLPAGYSETDVKATYRDGVLEIRVPTTEQPRAAGVKIPIARG
ncbi:MAG TPA: Hsp20/alpha crystallin family protein [Cellulomonas sp.]|nr:Hsp20/alpha crystallin family protein [Cellulomonas sp.]HEX5332544.1 Hsp20/alpha crystallin family protein [Cellulomonas sp.]